MLENPAVLLVSDAGSGATFSVRFDEAGAEFVETNPRFNGFDLRLWVPAGSLSALADGLETGLGVDDAATSTDEPAVRLVDCLAGLAGRGGLNRGGRDRVAGWCEEAGVRHACGFAKTGGDPQLVKRWHPLLKDRQPNGINRTLSVMFWPGDGTRSTSSRFGVRFSESYGERATTAGYYSHEIDVAYGSLSAVVDHLTALVRPGESADEAEDRLVASLAALVERGELGGELAPGQSRDRIMDWYGEAGVPYQLSGTDRRHTVLEVYDQSTDRVCTLSLRFASNTKRPKVEFHEAFQPPGDPDGRSSYWLETPAASLETLVAHFSVRLGDSVREPGPSATDEDRLIACFDALVAAGELRAGLPHRHNRNRVAQWWGAAGAPVELRGTTRRESLLKVHRSSTDCIFRLSLSMDQDGHDRGICFRELYDYLPRRGDAGREYSYGVRTPYSSLPRMVEFFETRMGLPAVPSAELEDRLVACFAALVERGDLEDGIALRENRDRVTVWFTEAGVPHEPADSHWINSD